MAVHRWWSVVGLVLAAGLVGPAPAEAAPPGCLPSTYVVSTEPGVLPEGIGVAADGRTFYVSGNGNGAVYRSRIGSARLQPFVPAGDGSRRTAAGVHVDAAGRVFVARGTALDVYDRSARRLVSRGAPAGAAGPASLNDLVITRGAVYVTDSANAVIYRAVRRGGTVGPLRPWLDVRTLQPDYPVYYWYLNGIVAAPDGRTLLVAAQGIGALIRVDVETRAAGLVDTGGASLGADGLQLDGRRTLYAVLNYEPPAAGAGLYRLRLSSDWRAASGLARVPDPGLDDPTTVAIDARHRFLVVNSQLEHAPGTPPYTVTAFPVR